MQVFSIRLKCIRLDPPEKNLTDKSCQDIVLLAHSTSIVKYQYIKMSTGKLPNNVDNVVFLDISSVIYISYYTFYGAYKTISPCNLRLMVNEEAVYIKVLTWF